MLSQTMCNEVLWADSIIIPNANNSDNRIVDREEVAKHCPGHPLSVANRRVDVQQHKLKVDTEH